MASEQALKVADIVDDLSSISSKTSHRSSITISTDQEGDYNCQLVVMGNSEQFADVADAVVHLQEIQALIGVETNKAAAHRKVFVAREKRKLEAKAARIAAQLVELDKPYAPVVDAGE